MKSKIICGGDGRRESIHSLITNIKKSSYNKKQDLRLPCKIWNYKHLLYWQKYIKYKIYKKMLAQKFFKNSHHSIRIMLDCRFFGNKTTLDTTWFESFSVICYKILHLQIITYFGLYIIFLMKKFQLPEKLQKTLRDEFFIEIYKNSERIKLLKYKV